MGNKIIVVILVLIIIVLATVLGIMVLQPTTIVKEPTKIKITSENSLYEGDSLSIKLTDFNKTPISKENVDIIITNKKGNVVVNKTLKTNSKGNIKVDLNLKKGTYKVNATYAGNNNYTGNSTAQKLTVKEAMTESSGDNRNTNIFTKYSSVFGYYRTVETQQELAVIETANGNYYVLAGDGYYTYAGHDSNGYIKLGNYVGKY